MPDADLNERYRQSVHDARVARDAVRNLLQQFKTAEAKAGVEESKFAAINGEIAELDKAYAAEDLPTDQETFQYGEKRLALLEKRGRQLQAMQIARQIRENLRMDTLRADQSYARLDQQRQNVKNLMDGQLGELKGGAFYVA